MRYGIYQYISFTNFIFVINFSVMKKILQKTVLYIVRFIGLLPSTLVYYLFSFFAYITFIVDKKHRIRAMENIRSAFRNEMSEKEIKKSAYESFRNMFLTFVEMCRIPRIKKKNLHKFIRFENLEYFEEAYKRGKGVLFCTGHFGSWEIMPHCFALWHKPLHIVARPLDSDILDGIVSYFRTYSGNRIIKKKNALKSMVKILKSGEALGTLHDQNVKRREGIFVDFFGKEACTSFAPAIIAIRTEAAIIPIYTVREGKNKFVMKLEKPIIPNTDNNRDDEIFKITQALTKSLEAIIRKYPGQWFWVHRRWKTKPKKNETEKERRMRKIRRHINAEKRQS
ncbi:MAG: hypothetical protein D6734_00600 [Candidatus Schekmanbacteria bacterium]|nr:MAG: hypothetical protein D6734_00600 [Candidatus Schekmanbacteria bacterium]